MRILFLYEMSWCDALHTDKNNIVGGCTDKTGYKVLAMSRQMVSNEQIRNVYNFLWKNGNRPYMTETASGNIRIQYFNKEKTA